MISSLLAGTDNLGLTLIITLISLALLLSVIAVHEWAHAAVAAALGDPTARSLGRLTINPRAHLDPWGLMFLLLAGFGWGKPVPINPANFRNPRRDQALVALAGPGANLLLAGGLILLIKILPEFTGTAAGLIPPVIIRLIVLNLGLAVFNLLPIHPLDGFKIVLGFLPPTLAADWLETTGWGVYLLAFLVLTGSLGRLLNPIIGGVLALTGV